MKITRIVIVGGGTAGWLAANHLGKALMHRDDVELTLIESPKVATIGVGEGTVPAIRQSLQSFGISETEFIKHCDVTFKQSIKFVNWLDSAKHGSLNAYHHLFDKPSPNGEDLSPLWCQDRSQTYADLVSLQYQACEAGKAPKSITTPEWQGQLGYAYHLNALKFAQLLAANAKQKFKVVHKQTHIEQVVVDESGHIRGLVSQDQGLLNYDFYIDCSGTEALLMSKALQVPFHSVAEQLLVDTALAVQVPTAPQQAIPPYTVATAHQAGWIWDIALTQRRGVGLVYSSQHMDEETASAKLRAYLGPEHSQLPFRRIDMKVGYLTESWRGNCVALGLAQGFLEPLEATSIMLTDFSAKLLAERIPQTVEQLPLLAQRFNAIVGHGWQRVVDFIKLHYYLSDRSDSQFWRDNRNPQHLSSELQQRLALWQDSLPQRADFFSKFEAFDVDNYLYVLYGMHFSTQLPANPPPGLYQQAQQLAAAAQRVRQALPEHRDLIERIHQYGLQKH
ncbi:tryptophan halogenase family protein [Shewanella sp. NIFS-20-20]|uniref:tryptophan halogenase family protein n=1 Tax=Shewanella sp. NIFS-20-20 TaxID=2853806 RepID=UPI001C484B6E|nr:tryptophan halogenase family protein [Shewanella sp. NIFS-20-20]MBV7315432.1 tryptophan 7-halogenase [Shewanella sp. NIFS-20-20]